MAIAVQYEYHLLMMTWSGQYRICLRSNCLQGICVSSHSLTLILTHSLSNTQYPYIHMCVCNFTHGSILTLILLVVRLQSTLRTWHYSIPLQKKCWILNKTPIHHTIPLQQSLTWTLYWKNRSECPYCAFIFLEKSEDGFLSLWFCILIWKLDNQKFSKNIPI